MVNHKKEQLEKKIVAVKLKNPVRAYHDGKFIYTRYGYLVDDKLFMAKVSCCLLFDFYLKNPISNAAQAIYKVDDIGEYEVLKEDRDFELIPRYYCGSNEEAIFSHFLLSFKGGTIIEPMEQPEECIYGYGTCCYPIEECHDCPNRREE